MCTMKRVIIVWNQDYILLLSIVVWPYDKLISMNNKRTYNSIKDFKHEKN